MAQCISCGFDRNRTGAKFCLNCGARLTFLASGDVLQGRYRIVTLLGKGGMGAVCLAEDIQTFGSRCVVKELTDYFNPADPSEVTKARKRFEDEARTLAQLNHPSIPEVRDYFSQAGRNYMVMEFIEGENLEDRLAREGKPLALEEVIQYAIQVCRVLEYLGAQQPPLVHHDIKPANIVVNREANTVSLVDFGTAKVRFVQAGGQLGKDQSSVYGTIGYAPQEQYGDKPKTEPRSDVYALGATLYHLLTGDDPSDHPFHFQINSLPTAVRRVLEEALQSNVQQRPGAKQMRQGLEAIETKAAPFYFRSGAAAHNLAELVESCDRNWEDARFHFYRQDFENWLRTSLHRHDLVSKVLPIRQRGGDEDAGLEEFLHTLDPALAPPTPDVSPSTLDFGSLEVGQTGKKTLKISNKTGRGHLSGHIVVDPPVVWLQVPDKFSGNVLAVEATVDTSGQKEGSRLHTKIQIQTPHVPSVEIPVRAHVALVWRKLFLTLLKFVTVGALTSAGLAYLMAQAVLPSFSWAVSDSLLGSLGLLAALIGLIVGARLGHGKGFSWKGCVLGGALSYPVLGYAYHVLALQFMILQRWGGDEAAYLGFALLGIWIGSVLGFYQGLRKARRKGWAAIVSLLVVLAPIAMFWRTGMLDLRNAYMRLGGSEVPVPYVVFAGSEPSPTPLPISTPAPTRRYATNTPTRLHLTSTPTARPTRTPTPTQRKVTSTPTRAPAVPPTLPPPCPHAEARITSPGVNAMLKGIVQIRGTANIRDFQFYKVEFGAGDKPSTWSVIGDNVVRERVVDDVLVTWDTGRLPPGVYTLQLTVVDITGNFPFPPCKVKVNVAR